MLENRAWIFDGIGAALIVLFFTWVGSLFNKSLHLWVDGQKIYKWLEVNTRDEPHKSHKTLLEISNGTRLSEERIQKACLQNKKIFQSTEKPGNYSIWRIEPKSIYEKRGILSLKR